MNKASGGADTATVEFADSVNTQRLASSQAYASGRYRWAKEVAPGSVAEFEARIEARRKIFSSPSA